MVLACSKILWLWCTGFAPFSENKVFMSHWKGCSNHHQACAVQHISRALWGTQCHTKTIKYSEQNYRGARKAVFHWSFLWPSPNCFFLMLKSGNDLPKAEGRDQIWACEFHLVPTLSLKVWESKQMLREMYFVCLSSQLCTLPITKQKQSTVNARDRKHRCLLPFGEESVLNMHKSIALLNHEIFDVWFFIQWDKYLSSYLSFTQ